MQLSSRRPPKTWEVAARCRAPVRRRVVPDWSRSCSLDPAFLQGPAQELDIEQSLPAAQAQDLGFGPVIVEGEQMDIAIKVALALAELPIEIAGDVEHGEERSAAARTDEIEEDLGLCV